jgi:hypothetical protein
MNFYPTYSPEVVLITHLSRFEQGLESDLFLLQCCGALSSPEFFVRTIQERFGLSDYTSLDLTEQNE